MSSSDESLHELPQPYDISTAVSRALRLDSSGGTEVPHPAMENPANLLTATDDWNISKGPGCSLTALSHTYDEYIHLEMEACAAYSSRRDFLQSANSVGFDDFCNYLDSSGDEELESHFTYADYRSQSFSSAYEMRGREPPKKRRRSAFDYSSSPEVSPIKNPSPNSFPLMKPRYPWRVSLANAGLWKQFGSLGTENEMVITKNGRRMFPALIVSVSGLDPDSVYSVALDILPADNRRYKFLQTEWVPVGRADKKQVYRQYQHPDSPNVGSFWMEKPISFKLVKLTNNKNTKYDDQMILNSMQKYQVCLRVTSERNGVAQSYSFSETTFIAVTAYQNNKITQLKIDNNPYARAFRECIPSDSSRPERSGGHCRDRTVRAASSTSVAMGRPENRELTPEPTSTTSSSSHLSPAASSPQPPTTPQQHKCTSAISVESGFESGDCNDRLEYPLIVDPLSFPETTIMAQDSPCGYPLNYWPDDNSLYNPALITPPPLLDSASSFSEPYLRQSSMMAMGSQCDISPVKGFYPESDFDNTLIVDVESVFDNTCIIDVETVYDDDVFL